MSQYFDPIFLQSAFINFLLIPWFLIIIFIAFYIPGRIAIGTLLSKVVKGSFSQTVVSIALGIVLWGFQGVIFGYLNLRLLSYLYILAAFLYWLKKYRFALHFDRKVFNSTPFGWLLIAVFVIGIFGQNQQFAITAFEFSSGIKGFTGSLDDTMWHTGLIESLTRTFPPVEPGMNGVIVHNYHYWSNMVIAETVRVFGFPLLKSQYLFFGIFTSFMLGSLAYAFARQIGLGKVGIFSLVYLQFFSSDIIYLVTFLTRQLFIFNIHPLEDGTMLLENTPRAFSFIVLFLAVILLNYWIKFPAKKIGILITIVIGCIIGYKVHTGAMALIGLLFLVIYLVVKRRIKDLYILCSIPLAAIIYLPVNVGAGSAVFVPFEMTARNFVVQNGLGLSWMELARRIYSDHSNLLQSLRMDLMMSIVYTVSQFGLKVVGFIPLRKTISLLSMPLWLFIYGGVIGTFVFGFLFIQPVAPADIFNSFLAGSFFLAILASVTINQIIPRRNILLRFAFILILLSLTVPRWVYKTSTVRAYFQDKPPVVRREELEATRYLRDNNSNGVVLVFNKGQWDSHYSYVSIFARTNTYLSGQVIMGRHGVDFSKREEIIETIKKSNNVDVVNDLLEETRISYLYFYGKYNLQLEPELINAEKAYGNDMINIYKIIR